MDPEDADYKCTLSPSTLEKAMTELNEDPKQRLGQIQALRKWVKEQPHLVCRTDTKFLLAFLRRAKFSQLKARELIENILTAKTEFPEFMSNIDFQDPGVLGFIEKGIYIHLPKRDKEGRAIIIMRSGHIDLDDPKFSVANQMKCSFGLGELYRETEEDLTVHGVIIVLDFTGVSHKHLMRVPMDVQRKISKMMQDSNPERMKALHVYNAGIFVDFMWTVVKQFMKKKSLERTYVHSTMESMYKAIPMDLWPTEYLPDDYKGPSAGSIESIQAGVKKRLLDPEMRQRILDNYNERYRIDESKRPTNTPNESFRRLNLD